MTITYPAGSLTPNQTRRLSEGKEPQISYISPDGYATFHLMGPRSPIAGVQEGIIMLRESVKGMLAPWQTLDQAGANQDGVTFVDAVYSPAEIDMMIEAHGLTPAGTRQVIRDWINSWDAKQTGKLKATVDSNGDWYANVRWLKAPTDVLMRAQANRQKFLWTARMDDAFWYTDDSVASITVNGTTAGGQLEVRNTGDQPAWPRYLLYGPGTFKIGNGPGSSDYVEFGPLVANQIVLLETEPRRRSIVDLSSTSISQQLTIFQTILNALVTFASNNNTVPLLQQFESLFGIRPPQGNLYQYLKGRFSIPVPPAPISGAGNSNLPFIITGAGSGTKLVAAITPRRRWPL